MQYDSMRKPRIDTNLDYLLRKRQKVVMGIARNLKFVDLKVLPLHLLVSPYDFSLNYTN